MSSQAASTKIYTTQFWLLCTSSLLFFASFNMIVPELPSYLTSLGGPQYKGLIISLFTLTAMISRPFSGKLADKFGRVPVMMFGSFICFLSGFLYPVLSSGAGFLLLRLIHGFSTGFTPTGQAAYLSDVIPAQRRGEAMGMLGTAGTVGMAAGPAIGGVIANNFSIDFMFYASSFCGILSIAILYGIKETLPVRNRFSMTMLKVNMQDTFEPRVWLPSLVMLFVTYSYGTVLTIIPDFGEHVGIRNKGLLFTYFTMASLAIRLIAGRASDIYGRRTVLFFSVILIAVAMCLLGFGTTRHDLIIGIAVYGLGHGITSPTLLAWTTDLSDDAHKGRGIASLYIFMELGIGIGAFASALIYSNDPSKFMATFLTCSLLSVFAFFFLMLFRTSHKPIV
jgi:MFS family permease